MSESINWTLNVQVVGGPKVSASDVVKVGAYDKIEAVIKANEANKTVEVQPSDTVEFLLITASNYEKLSYKVDAAAKDIQLNAPQLLVGSGAVKLLGDTQKQFTIKNDNDKDVTVYILVGRDAPQDDAPTP